jgi:ferrous iron transport protein B
VVEKSVQKPEVRPKSWTDRLDKILIHRVWGTGIFLIIMFMMFQAIFVAAEPLMDLIESGTGWLSKKCTDLLPAGPVRSLLADGIISGVGGVLAFLPQILILFAFIAVLEDCGYMARAAYLMDRIMSRCGLSGKSFIPMLASVACAVPGIMATRVIENRRDRLATILVAPLMSCSARLPVYSLLIAAFLTENQPFWVPGLTLFVMYLIGFVVAPLVAWIVRKTLLRGERSPFLMELPAYKRPSLKLVVRRVWDAGGAFVRRAGSLILMSMVLIWALLYFPDRNTAGRYEDQIADLEQQVEKLQEKRESESTTEEEQQQLSEEQDDLNSRKATIMIEWKAGSLLGQTGQALEPLFSPLGWDWKIGMAALASFPAREVIVGTLSILYSAEPDDDDALRGKVSEEWSKDPIRGKYAVPVALSIMVFFALCCQCASTLAVIRRETRSWSWPLLTFTYMTLLAYVAAAATFQIGKLLVDAGS